MLVIGKRISRADSRNVGGAIILFEQLVSDLTYFDVDFEVVDINYKNYKNKLFAFFLIWKEILIKGRKHDVIFLNGSNNVLTLFGLPVFICKFWFNSKVVLRFFGGNFYSYLKYQILPIKILNIYFQKKADLLFFEQKYQVDFFQKTNSNTKWFPNMRNQIEKKDFFQSKSKNFHGRFVFISHVREEKGINEILKLKIELGTQFNIDVYGPVVNYIPPEELSETFQNIYKGSLRPEDVLKTLSQYDILVLPSHKEGYPGVIIEAFSLGLPVIATNLQGISEMMANYKAGILIEPRNIIQFKSAVHFFNKENYHEYSNNALKAFSLFDSKLQMPKIIEQIRSL